MSHVDLEHDEATDPRQWDWTPDAEYMVMQGFPSADGLDAALKAASAAIQRALSRGVAPDYARDVGLALLRFGEGAFECAAALAIADAAYVEAQFARKKAEAEARAAAKRAKRQTRGMRP